MAVLAVLWLPSLAAAQAQPVEPASALTVRDGRVTLAFDAPVEIPQVTLEVVNADGAVIGTRPVLRDGDPQVVTADIQPGTTPRIIRWRVLSRDGHVTSGVIAPPGERVSVPENPMAEVTAVVGRTLVVVALAVILGLVMLRWGVVGAAWRDGGLVPPGVPDDADAFKARAFPILEWAGNRWWDALWVAVTAWGVGLVATVVGTLWALDTTDIGGLLLHARLGQAAAVSTLLGLVTVGLGLWITRREDGDDPLPPAWQAVALGGPAAVGLVLVSWSGHAATGGDAALNIALDALHSGATAAWIGGLVGLITLLLPAGDRLDEDDRLRLVSAAVVRFSALGLVAVAVLVITGVYRAIAEVGSFGHLFGTAYGWVLVAKLLVFAGMCVVAGYNRFVVHPRLERAGLGLDETDHGAGRTLAATVGMELALSAVLLVLVGVLIGTAPPG